MPSQFITVTKNGFFSKDVFIDFIGKIFIFDKESDKILFFYQLNFEENEKILDFFIFPAFLNMNFDFLEMYLVTSFGKIYFLRKGF